VKLDYCVDRVNTIVPEQRRSFSGHDIGRVHSSD